MNSMASLPFVVPPKSPKLGDFKPKLPVQSPILGDLGGEAADNAAKKLVELTLS